MSMIEIKVPVLPESVSEASIATWYKKPGEWLKRDEHLLDIETDKVVLEVVAPDDGILESIKKEAGDKVSAEEVVGLFQAGAKENDRASDKSSKNSRDENNSNGKQVNEKQASEKQVNEKQANKTQVNEKTKSNQKVPEQGKQEIPKEDRIRTEAKSAIKASVISPSVRRLMAEKGLDFNEIQKAGLKGRITRENIEQWLEDEKTDAKKENQKIIQNPVIPSIQAQGHRIEKRVPMTRLRAKIAERLLQAQHTAAILTTFNEINMQPVMTLRSKYKETFEKAYGVRLGFMSFFTMAVVEALKHFPIMNASVDDNDIIYHGFYDIGIAVSSPRGLVVPVLRNVEALNMAEIEKQIGEYAEKAQTNQLAIEDLKGGTFTISNGGVFGSLMSTPILNPPQSAILGMHKIQERPIAENGQVVIRPMMYVALSYDHRIIDGADSVRFLVTVKELLEDPARLALGI